MDNNTTLMIEATRNGFIVQERIPDHQTRDPETVVVFESNKSLLEFIDSHFDHLRHQREDMNNGG